MDTASWFALPERRSSTVRFALSLALAGGGIFVALFVLWRVQDAWLLAFASVVGAVLLRAAADPVENRLGLSRSVTLAIIAVVLLLLVGGFSWLLGHQLRAQFTDLNSELASALQYAQQNLGISLPGQDVQQASGSGLSALGSLMQQLFGTVVSVGGAVAGGVSAFVLVVVGAFFFAASPEMYRDGAVKLFPPPQHDRVKDALNTAGRALRLWLLAQLVSMAVVGVMVLVGTWLIGLRAPLALGLFAGITEFIPLIGPILGAVPAVLLALTHGLWTAVWTIVLFIIVQQIESNLIQPLIQRHMVELPPALLLFAVVAVGLMFGITGLVVAAPLTVVLYVLVKKLYVRDTLGEATSVPGET
ncbi:MAG: AI-2E family transporter [Rhodopila sp.]